MGAFRKLLLALSPTGFEAALSLWAEDCSAGLPVESEKASGLEPVALDGKAARGSLSRHRKAIHLLSVMAQRSGLTLIQAEVGEKMNEHKAALTLLRGLVLEGRVVTADAMFCQRDLCQDVLKQGGHYFVAVKENQPDLRGTSRTPSRRRPMRLFPLGSRPVPPGRSRNTPPSRSDGAGSRPAGCGRPRCSMILLR